MKDIPLSYATRSKVAELLEAGRKIQAIKLVKESSECSLKEAKCAVENYSVTKNIYSPVKSSSEMMKTYKNITAQITNKAFVQSVRLCVGEGTVEVDLEEAKFRILASIGDVGLEDARNVLKFIAMMEKFEEQGYD